MTTTRITEPTLEHRNEQPFVAIPIEAALREWARTTELVPELFGWLGQRGINPAGAPFYRYLVIGDMDPAGDKPFHLEVGIPVANEIAGDGRVIAGTIPGGTYATLTHHGHPDQLASATARLLEWAEREGVELAATSDRDDTVWAGRYQFYETDPAIEPDLNKWETVIAFLTHDPEANHTLPDGLSAPARRALATAGVGTLDDLARRSEKEILDLHGMGRKSIPILRAALADAGLAFANE